MKFLIIQTAFIGDVILATPVIEKIDRFYPNAQIDFLLRKGNEGLFQEHPKLHRIYVLDKRKHKYKNMFDITKTIRKHRYHYVINLHRFLSSGLITIFSKGKQTIGFNKNPLSLLFHQKIKHCIGKVGNFVHEVDRNLALIESITDSTNQKPKLYPPDLKYDRKPREKYICIAPASVWFTKQFPKQKWIELINNISPEYKIVLLGGKTDIPFCNSILQKTTHKGILSVAGELNLLESAAWMRDATLNFVNDSAPLHLASAVNAPVAAIYCSTIPDFGFAPLSTQSLVLQTKRDLKCRPCGLHGKKECPEKHFHCSDIDIKDILSETGLNQSISTV